MGTRRSGRRVGDRFIPRRPLRLGRDAPAKLAARAIRSGDVQAVLATNVIVQVIDHRDRFVLLGQIIDGHLIVVVADDDDDPGLLVVRGVPAEVCQSCDEYWFDEDTGFALSRVLQRHAPASGRVVAVDWVEVRAA